MLLKLPTLLLPALVISCAASQYAPAPGGAELNARPVYEEHITSSLFVDKNATISEENIHKILDGTFALPQQLRVAIVKIETNPYARRYFYTDEAYLKTQQAYLDSLALAFGGSPGVTRVLSVPDLLLSSNPTATTIREAAVRTQSDVAAIYTITANVYSKYKLFSKSDIKAFATTQLIVMDVRTGLIPFSTVVTRDVLSRKTDADLTQEEAVERVKREAALLTIAEIQREVQGYLAER